MDICSITQKDNWESSDRRAVFMTQAVVSGFPPGCKAQHYHQLPVAQLLRKPGNGDTETRGLQTHSPRPWQACTHMLPTTRFSEMYFSNPLFDGEQRSLLSLGHCSKQRGKSIPAGTMDSLVPSRSLRSCTSKGPGKLAARVSPRLIQTDDGFGKKAKKKTSKPVQQRAK